MKKLLFLSQIALLFFSADANAGKRYYIMNVTGTWNTTLSWSGTSGGGSGASVPGSTDTAYFDGNGTGACVLDAAVNVKRLNVGSGYTGTITHGLFSITIGTGGAVFSGGTFAGGSAAITCTSAVTISGCAFTSTSGTFTTNSNWTYSSGSFAHNNGRMKFTATNTVTGSVTFYKLEFAPASTSTYTIAGGTTLTVSDTLLISGTVASTLNTGSISANGDVVITNNFSGGGGTATVTLNGTGSQALTGGTLGATGRLPNMVINKSSGTLSLSNTISVLGNWTYTAGTVSAGTSRIHFAGTKTITGSHTLYSVRFGAAGVYTIAGGTTLTTTGTIEYVNNVLGNITINTGTIHAQGNIDLKNPVTGGGGSASIVINGTGSQTVTGNATAGNSALPNVTINKSSGTLTLDSTITVAGNWTYTAGNLSTSTGTVCFWNTKTISGSHSLANVGFNNSANATFTISSGNTLTITGLLSIDGSNLVAINTGTIYAQGNITLSNTFNGNSAGGSASMVINGSGSQTLTGNASRGNSRLPNVVINKTTGTLYLIDYVNIQGNFTYTAGTVDPGSSTLHFSGSKTISGSLTLFTISFGASTGLSSVFTISPSTILTAGGNFETAGVGNIIIDSGQIYVHQHIVITNTGTGGGGDATITLNGASAQTITGSGTAGTGGLPNVTIDKSTDTLTLASVTTIMGNWIYTQGTVSPGTSTVAFYGTKNLDGQQSGSTNCMPFYNITINGNTRTLTGHVDANNNFTIASGATCSAGSNKIYVGGDWNSVGTWTYSTSTVVFDGIGHNKIKGTGTVNFFNVTVNRSYSAGSPTSVNLQNPMQVNSVMILTKGRVITDATNYLAFPDGAVCTLFNDDSAYVCGPIRKTGNDPFKFHLGDTTLHDSIAYHPLDMSAPSNTSDRFQAIYTATAQSQGATIVDSLTDLSTCEHWSLERQVGSSNVQVGLSWNKNSCNTGVYGDLRVANWNGTQWSDLGASSILIAGYRGDISSVTNVTFVSSFAYLTTAVSVNYFPTAILKKKLDGGYYKAINGRLFFRFDEEYAESGDLLFNIYDDEHTLVSSNSMLPATLQLQVVYGDNRYHLNTVGCDITPSGALADGFYILEVINDKNEKWYLRFEQDSNIILSNCPPPAEEE